MSARSRSPRDTVIVTKNKGSLDIARLTREARHSFVESHASCPFATLARTRDHERCIKVISAKVQLHIDSQVELITGQNELNHRDNMFLKLAVLRNVLSASEAEAEKSVPNFTQVYNNVNKFKK